MIINYTIRFYLHKERSGRSGVHARVSVRSIEPVQRTLGILLDTPDSWDETRQRIVHTHPKAHEYNWKISECESAIRELIAKYEHVEKRLPTAEDVKHALCCALGGGDMQSHPKDSFSSVMDAFVQENDKLNHWSHSTHQKFHTLLEHVTGFAGSKLIIDSIDDDFMRNFTNYLINRKGLRNTSTHKMVKFLRWVLRWASLKGIYRGNAHNTFKTRLKGANFEQKEVIYLTLNELKRMESHTFSKNEQHLERVRDVFIFCCYSGLRFSDAAKLKTSDIHDGYISVVTRKTNELLRIELNSHSNAILQRYASKHFPDNLALPVISNQKSNEYLKDIGMLCKIDEPVRIVYYKGNERIEEVHPKHELLTTHVARRTFVVTALQLGIPAEVIIRWTGHKDYEAMKPYVAIVDELKKKSMDKFNTL